MCWRPTHFVAVVLSSPRLSSGGGKELEEPLVVRPTSETIVNHMFAQWVQVRPLAGAGMQGGCGGGGWVGARPG